MEILPSHPEPSFFRFKNINLQYFVILLDGNVIVAMQYSKTMTIFINFCEKKSFNLTMSSAFEKPYWKSEDLSISGSLHWGSNWWN